MTFAKIFHERPSQVPLHLNGKSADPIWCSGCPSEATTPSHSLADAHATGAMDAYESIGCASFLVEGSRQVVRYNQTADRLLGDGLELSRGKLRASHPPSNLALGELIASRACGRDSDLMAVLHRPVRRPLIVRSAISSGPAASVSSSSAFILLVSDMEKCYQPTPLPELVATFALTMTEAKLVTMLERELPLCEAAAEMNITFQTARTHLKRILSKTQTTRQQDLLTLLHRLRP